MQKKLLAVAVAGALAAPAVALAQSSVTVSGAINIWYEQAGATGATNASTGVVGGPSTYDVKSRDRMQDGAGSNIRFTAVEDIGSGLQGFMQVESAVINQANTRADGIGNAGAVGGWGTRNSGVGLRGAAWGEFLIGIWDIHYNEQYAVDNQLIKGPSHSSVLALLNSFGTPGMANGAGTLGGITIGARYGNVLRYQSPSWGGFNFKVAYARPNDGLVNTTAGDVREGTKNKAFNFAPQYSNGPIFVGWSYLKDSDIQGANASTVATAGGQTYAGATGGPTVAANLWTVTSSRLSAAYTLPFGLKLGAILDSSKLEGKASGTGFGTELKRTVWAIPISWNTGAHTIFATYAVAGKLKGNLGSATASNDVSTTTITPAGGGAAQSIGDNSKAKFYSLGYQFDLSKRTNVHVNFSQIKNDALVGYDMFANAVGMANGNFGADPRVISLGLRHAF